jgi:glycosyltransferase involved in cell wall biosynthesis
MTKNKLVIIQPALGRYRKGFIDSLVSENDNEFDISIICSQVDNAGVKSMDSIHPSIEYNLVKMTSIFKVFFWQHLFFIVLKMNLSKGDSLIINGNPRFLSSIAISLFLKLKGIEVYWWGHAWSSTSSKVGSYIRFKLMNLYKIILYTDEEVELSKGLIKSDVVGLNNGLDILSIRKGILFDKNKFEFKIFKIAFIGRYTKKSNFGLLIQALSQIPANELEYIQLNVIGNIPEQEMLKLYPQSKNININYHGEIWDEHEISNLLNDNHVFVYPGSVGLSIIHAFALGLPAVVHNERIMHMPEIGVFEDRVNGISFTNGCSKSLAEKILYLKHNVNVLKEYSDNAYSKVTTTYNTHDMATRFMTFIRKKK